MANKILFALVLNYFFVCGVTQSGNTHIITLNVDTQSLTNGNINNLCYFTPEQDVDIIEYNTDVQINDLVIWKGVSSSSPDTDVVAIKSINYEGGTRVFDKNVLRDDDQNPGVVVGLVSNGREGNQQKYKISFRVYKNGNRQNGTYHIDPKLTIRQ